MMRAKVTFHVQNLFDFPIFFNDLTWEMKMEKRFGREIVMMYAYIFLECFIDFIDGQGCEEGEGVQWNISKRLQYAPPISKELKIWLFHDWRWVIHLDKFMRSTSGFGCSKWSMTK